MGGNFDWLGRAREYISLNVRLADDTSLKDRRIRLRAIGWQFHGGTFWGRRQFGKACREYLERHGQSPRQPREVESAPNFGPDIIFPFRVRDDA